MPDERIEIMRRVALFDGLSDRELEAVANASKERRFDTGDTVVGEGEGGVGFFVVAGFFSPWYTTKRIWRQVLSRTLKRISGSDQSTAESAVMASDAAPVPRPPQPTRPIFSLSAISG